MKKALNALSAAYDIHWVAKETINFFFAVYFSERGLHFAPRPY